MFTTGFKFFFGIGVALSTAAVLYGYTTGGNHMGPVSMGWKGGVGDHVGYTLLLSLGFMALILGLVLVTFRDADPAAQAHYMGVDEIAPTTPVTGSFWPVVGAFGVGAMAVGLVVHTVVFVVGLIACSLVAIEWTMDAWADRATGDPAANRVLRNRVMAPIEIPALGAIIVAVGVLSMSRILLSVSANGAVAVAGVTAVLIVGIGSLFAAKPRINKNIISGLVLTLGVVVIAGGIAAGVTGEREFERHEVDDEHSEDDSTDHEHGDDENTDEETDGE